MQRCALLTVGIILTFSAACERASPTAPQGTPATAAARGLNNEPICGEEGVTCTECVMPQIDCLMPGDPIPTDPSWCDVEIPVCVECSGPECNPDFTLPQTISFVSTPPAPGDLGATYAISATATSALAVQFSSLTPAVCSVTGSTATFTAIGTCTIAADQGGDTIWLPAAQVTQNVAVAWPFTGFLPPVDSYPAPNVATAGRSVPLKFRLGGNRGLSVLAAGSPASAGVPCPSGTPGATTPAETAGRSSLSYDVATDVYTFVWATKAGWKNSCRRLSVSLTDGTVHEALFSFK